MTPDQRLLATLGTIASQVYLVGVFIAAVQFGDPWVMRLALSAEGLTACGYQVQLLSEASDARALWVTATLITCAASWIVGAIAGGLLLL